MCYNENCCFLINWKNEYQLIILSTVTTTVRKAYYSEYLRDYFSQAFK